MRILFAEAEYPYMHGSFLETAVRAAASSGFEAHVWSADAKSGFPHPLVARLHTNEPISACIDRVRPDIVHTHYLDLASRLAPEVASRGVPRAMAKLMRRAAIYMYTPPNHPAGMSISVAESMACGCLVLAPDIGGMRAYLGESGGRVYQTPAEAAEIVRSTASWSAGEWRELSRRASAYAARHYSMSVVAPRLVAEWRRVLEERAPMLLPVRGWWRRLGGRVKAAA